MSILAGGILLGGDTPDMPDTPDTPDIPISTPRHVKGIHIARLGFDGTYTYFQQLDDWELVNPIQTWIRFEHENYLGTHHADPVIISGTHQVGHFYFRTSDNQWRGIFQNGGLSWQDWNLRSATGVDLGSDRGAFDSEADASNNLFQPDTLTNWAFFDGHYWVYRGERLFDGQIYIENEGVIILPHAVISTVQLGYLFEMTRVEIANENNVEIVGSFISLQGNTTQSAAVFQIGGTLVTLSFVEIKVIARTITEDRQPTEISDIDGYRYELNMYIAEN